MRRSGATLPYTSLCINTSCLFRLYRCLQHISRGREETDMLLLDFILLLLSLNRCRYSLAVRLLRVRWRVRAVF